MEQEEHRGVADGSPDSDNRVAQGRGLWERLGGIADLVASSADKVFRLVAGYAVFLASIQVLTLGLSVAHVVISQPVAIAILVFSAAAGYLQWFFLRGLCPEPSSGEVSPPVGVKLSTVFLLFSLLFYGFMWIEAYLKPDRTWDGIAYHIPTIHFWAQEGYVHWITPELGLGSRGVEFWVEGQIPKFFNGLPFGAEVCAFVLVRATGNSHFLNTVNLVYLPLGVLSLIYLSRILGAGPHVACLAGMAFLYLPVNVQQSGSIMIDSGFACCVLALMASVSFVMLRASKGRLPGIGAIPLGATLGLTAGSKVWGPAVVAPATAALVLYLFLVSMLAGRKKRTTGSSRQQDRSAEGQCVDPPVPSRGRVAGNRVLFLAVAFALATAVGGYWFIRNYVKTGNPVWPAKVSIAGHVLFPYAYEVDPKNERTRFPAHKLWLQGGIGEGRTQWPRSIREHSNWWGGAGFLWILGCVPSTILVVCWSLIDHGRLLLRKSAGRLPYGSHLLVLVLITVVAFALIPLGGRIRYTLWIFGVGLPCFAGVVQWILQREARWFQPWWWAGRLWIGACLAILLFEGLYTLSWWSTRSYAWTYSTRWPRFDVDPLLAAKSLFWHDPVGYVIPQLSTTVFEEILTGPDAVALGEISSHSLYKLIIGQLCMPIGARSVFFLDHDTASNREALAEFLGKHRIRYVVWDYTIPVPGAMRQLVKRDVAIPFSYRVLEFSSLNAAGIRRPGQHTVQ